MATAKNTLEPPERQSIQVLGDFSMPMKEDCIFRRSGLDSELFSRLHQATTNSIIVHEEDEILKQQSSQQSKCSKTVVEDELEEKNGM
ncbi:hypothetical protein KIN20_005552 [Parelaphostrongylus tenuis]|uniref:Uncharacterized protein n=1 Tax=Parelaphostrongylus tenuis TaxID=148309 RepID=A0AAD5MIW5_PARTN|nr:hypothetical protein KIN20_005552 [Parelaphostrongylus tenuis]